MKNLLCIIFIFLFWSCTKDTSVDYPQGVYVEETLRLDTIDFTINNQIDASELSFVFKSKTFQDPVNPVITIYNSGLYNFQIQNNETIQLRNMISSSSAFNNYYFSWVKNNTYFEIGKFYNRPNLPDRVKFIKL